ncbi:MAG: hypothetical protein Q8933_09455 [Bacteroidota bacterium]|nr:hypothetical protein [Bacteroidota bacterium]
MNIDTLIENLKEVREKQGNIECVQEIKDFFDKTIDSTIETVRVVDFLGKKAVKLDWRT